MTPKQSMTTPKMTRVTVRVPKATLAQINEWVSALGVRRSHFLGIALVSGARSLMQANAPGAEALAPPADISAEERAGDLGQVIDDLKTEIADLRAALTELQEQQRP